MDGALLRNLLLIAWTLVAVTACGAGGGVVAGGGTGGTGISYGAVTGFGSVFVNGVEIDTTNSTVTLNGSPGPDAITDPHRGLMVGMVVEVQGTFDSNGTTGTANSITYKDNLTGPVSSITNPLTGVLNVVVLGQNVIIDNQTALAGITSLALDNVIEVSGLPDNNGNIHATLVSLKSASFVSGTDEIGIRGTIQNLDSTLKTFQINGLTVDYASATNLPLGVPANGQFVNVRGTNLAGLVLIADSVALDDNSLGVTDASVAQIEGYVTSMTSQSQFTVGAQPVQTTASTVFEGGMASDIVPGAKLGVQGSLAGGILIATKVSFL